MRLSRYPPRFITLLCIFLPSIGVESFSPHQQNQHRHNRIRHRHSQWNSNASIRKTGHRWRYSTYDLSYCQESRLFASDDDEHEEKASSDSSERTNDNNDEPSGVGQKVGFGILSIFGYSLQLASWLISAGLVLNIFGYGYQIDSDAQYGVRIDTLRNIRQDNQMRAEFERMGRQQGGSSPDPLRRSMEQQQKHTSLE